MQAIKQKLKFYKKTIATRTANTFSSKNSIANIADNY